MFKYLVELVSRRYKVAFSWFSEMRMSNQQELAILRDLMKRKTLTYRLVGLIKSLYGKNEYSGALRVAKMANDEVDIVLARKILDGQLDPLDDAMEFMESMQGPFVLKE